jgi:ABC-type sugar transport system ATPase subunit
MVYVTHDQTEALTLGDTVAVLRAGELQQVAPPEELWARPANRFVARFVGSPPMNVLPADGPFAVDGLPTGRPLELGIRPEHLKLAAEGVPADVTLVELIGSEALVHLRAGGHELVARVTAAGRPEAGSAVHVEFAREDVHLFDAESAERVEWT